MFLVDMTFVKPLDVVDAHVAQHRDYLASFYDAGVLLFGGRKKPRTGGVIVSRQSTLEDVKALFDADPLVKAGVASYSVIEFEPVMRARDMVGIV